MWVKGSRQNEQVFSCTHFWLLWEMYHIRKTIFSRVVCPPSPQHFFSQLRDWASVIWTCFAVFCGHWAHQIHSDNKQSNCVFGQAATSLLRSFWAARKCWRRKWAEMIKLFGGSETREWRLFSGCWVKKGCSVQGNTKRVKYSRFLFKIWCHISSLFWAAFLIQLFTAVQWGRTSRHIQSIFRTWNEKFSLVGSVVCQLARFEISKCQKTGVSFGQQSVGQHGGGKIYGPVRGHVLAEEEMEEMKLSFGKVSGKCQYLHKTVDEGMAFFFFFLDLDFFRFLVGRLGSWEFLWQTCLQCAYSGADCHHGSTKDISGGSFSLRSL